MSTSASTKLTPLESLFLLRGILSKGLNSAAFTHISHVLSNNSFIKDAPAYDASRLTPESLKSAFLQLLWDHVQFKEDSAPNASRHDVTVSPASKRRRLQPPSLPTLRDVRNHHLDKVIDIANRLEAEYREFAIRAIREDEARYDQVQSEIVRLELEELQVHKSTATDASSSQQNAAATTSPRKDKPANGSRSPPAPQHPPPSSKEPAVPSVTETGKTATQPSAPSSEQADRQSQQSHSAGEPASGTGLEGPKQPNGTAVLQAPAAVSSPIPPAVPGVGQGTQRPEAAGRPKQPTAPPPSQTQPTGPTPPVSQPSSQAQAAVQSQSPAGQSQLSWQPPYQPPRPSMQHPNHRPLQPSPVAQRNQPGFTHNRPSGPMQQAPPVNGKQTPQQPQPVSVQPQSTPQPLAQNVPSTPAADSAPVLATKPEQPNVPSSTEPAGIPAVAASQTPSADNATRRAQPPQTKQPLVPTPHGTSEPKPATGTTVNPAEIPAPVDIAAQKPRSSPHRLPPRPAIPPHLQAGLPPNAGSLAERVLPSTPARQLARPILTITKGGSGTKWKSNPTPSTPKPSPTALDGSIDSPAMEPLSPGRSLSSPPAGSAGSSTKKSRQQQPPTDAAARAALKRRGRPPRGATTATSSSPPARASTREPVEAPAAEPVKKESEVDRVKHEESTPRPPTEAGDTTADESVVGKRHASRLAKRKRRDSSPTPVQTPTQPPALTSLDSLSSLSPTEILWTRAFNKVSGSAMEQIVHHRSANMFAHPIREKDAPGYSKVILRPQDLKSIRAAITHGNKAAGQAAVALAGGDPGTSTVRLPISEEIVPPRGIVNSSQLDRELAHMFSNAVMYNPDPFHGPGPAFLRPDDEVDPDTMDGTAMENVLGYKVDEFGVVKDARAMFVEVEKLVSELRSAEIQRARPLSTAGTSTRHASVAAGGNGDTSVLRDEDGSILDDVDEQTVTETENVGNPVKRRRTTRG